MNKLWSEEKTEDEILKVNHYEATLNLLDDIQCLKEEIKESARIAKIEVVEKVESFSNGVSMHGFKSILKGYASAIRGHVK